MGALRLVIGIFGNITSIFLFTAPVLTFKRVVIKRSTEEFSCIPYIISLLNCVVYSWYASPVVSHGWKNAPLITVDGIGTLLELSFIIIYLWFAPGRAKVKAASMTSVVILLSILVVIITIFAFDDHHHRDMFVGSVAVVASSVMYGSPLVAMKTVIETKSVEFMPFYLSFFTLLTSCLWGIYGFLDFDIFIVVPNLIGTILGIVQLVLYFKYRKTGIKGKNSSMDIEKSDEKTKEEMQSELKNSTVEA